MLCLRPEVCDPTQKNAPPRTGAGQLFSRKGMTAAQRRKPLGCHYDMPAILCWFNVGQSWNLQPASLRAISNRRYGTCPVGYAGKAKAPPEGAAPSRLCAEWFFSSLP